MSRVCIVEDGHTSQTPSSSLCQLTGKLLTNFRSLMAAADEATQAALLGSAAEEVAPRSFQLETKYYRATIAIDEGEIIGSETGAILTVMSSSRANQVMTTGEKPETKGGADVPVRLLVVIRSQGEAELSEEARYGCAVWSLDNSHEFIDVDMLDLASTFHEREKEGLPRLIEALEANMWSCMDKVTAASSSVTAASSSVTAASSSMTTASSSVTAASSSETTVFVSSTTTLQEEPENEESASLDKFSELMANALQWRQDAQAGKVSDEERREKAAAFALQFSAMLDDGEDDDDDEDNHK